MNKQHDERDLNAGYSHTASNPQEQEQQRHLQSCLCFVMQLNYMCIHCEEKGAVILLENVTEVAQQRASFSSHPHSM